MYFKTTKIYKRRKGEASKGINTGKNHYSPILPIAFNNLVLFEILNYYPIYQKKVYFTKK